MIGVIFHTVVSLAILWIYIFWKKIWQKINFTSRKAWIFFVFDSVLKCFYLSLYLDITLFDKYTPERRQGRASVSSMPSESSGSWSSASARAACNRKTVFSIYIFLYLQIHSIFCPFFKWEYIQLSIYFCTFLYKPLYFMIRCVVFL